MDLYGNFVLFCFVLFKKSRKKNWKWKAIFTDIHRSVTNNNCWQPQIIFFSTFISFIHYNYIVDCRHPYFSICKNPIQKRVLNIVFWLNELAIYILSKTGWAMCFFFWNLNFFVSDSKYLVLFFCLYVLSLSSEPSTHL